MTEHLPIGEQIKQARLALRITQKELGRLCGFHQAKISLLELGIQSIRVLTLKKLEEALGVRLNPLEGELFEQGARSKFEDMDYNLLKLKIKNLCADEVLTLPGTTRLAQLIRMNLRRDREVNKKLPAVCVAYSGKAKEILISHRGEILKGVDMKISKIDAKDVPVADMFKYQELIDHAKEISDGQSIKIIFDDEMAAMNAASSIGGYKITGKIPDDVHYRRRGKVLYLFK